MCFFRGGFFLSPFYHPIRFYIDAQFFVFEFLQKAQFIPLSHKKTKMVPIITNTNMS